MIHPHTEVRFVSEGIGYGAVATRRIPKGTITWVRTELDRTFAPDEVKLLTPASRAVLAKYAYLDGAGDSVLCWDHARFMNHSCDPTCLSPGYEFDVAVRDIEAGEQLTCEYGGLNLKHAFQCLCGARGCRGMIRASDLTRIAPEVDRKLRAVMPVIDQVEQPLWALLAAADKRAVKAAAQDPERMRSSLGHFCAEPEPKPSPARRRTKAANGVRLR